MSRHHTNWIDTYLEYTADHESPEKIHFWTAISILSAVVRRHLFMERIFYNLFPNTYVIIVAESARARKSVAMEIGVRLLKKACPNVFIMEGKMTPEGLVACLNRSTVSTSGAGTQSRSGTIYLDSHVFIYGDELATLFGYDRVAASRMAILLTQIYGSPEYYPHTTSGEGVKELFNLYPGLLVATDPRNLKVLPEEAIAGLLGRLIYVHATGTRKSTAWLVDGQKARAREFEKTLITDLAHIATLSGEMTPTQEAKEIFTNWYEKLQGTRVDDPRIDPFIARCHDTALKIAMIMSIATKDTLVVNADDMAAGIAMIEKQLPESTRVIQWTGSTPFAQNKVKFIETLTAHGGYATRKDMLRIMDIPLDEFNSIEDTLVQEERLLKTGIPRLGVVYKTRDEKKGEKKDVN